MIPILFELTEGNKRDLIKGTRDTFLLLGLGGALIVFIGLFLGVLIFISANDKIIKRNKVVFIVNKIFSAIIDTCRSVPFIVLIVVLIPVTAYIVGTMIGWKGAMPALIISAAPFFARITANALKEVPSGTIEACKAMGASAPKIIAILLKEALPSLVSGLTVTLVTLAGFIAAAGAVGAGGLGDLAIRMGLSRRQDDMLVMFIAIAILLVIVFVIQYTGDFIAKKIDRR